MAALYSYVPDKRIDDVARLLGLQISNASDAPAAPQDRDLRKRLE